MFQPSNTRLFQICQWTQQPSVYNIYRGPKDQMATQCAHQLKVQTKTHSKQANRGNTDQKYQVTRQLWNLFQWSLPGLHMRLHSAAGTLCSVVEISHSQDFLQAQTLATGNSFPEDLTFLSLFLSPNHQSEPQTLGHRSPNSPQNIFWRLKWQKLKKVATPESFQWPVHTHVVHVCQLKRTIAGKPNTGVRLDRSHAFVSTSWGYPVPSGPSISRSWVPSRSQIITEQFTIHNLKTYPSHRNATWQLATQSWRDKPNSNHISSSWVCRYSLGWARHVDDSSGMSFKVPRYPESMGNMAHSYAQPRRETGKVSF